MIEGRPRWRGRTANLVFVGAAGTLVSTGLAACSDNSTFHRNAYATEADCVRDYSVADCQRSGSSVPQGLLAGEQSAWRFLGPVYRMSAGRHSPCRSDDLGPGRAGLGLVGASARLAVAPVERGGFGTQCRSRGSSGTYGNRNRGRSFGWGS